MRRPQARQVSRRLGRKGFSRELVIDPTPGGVCERMAKDIEGFGAVLDDELETVARSLVEYYDGETLHGADPDERDLDPLASALRQLASLDLIFGSCRTHTPKLRRWLSGRIGGNASPSPVFPTTGQDQGRARQNPDSRPASSP